MEVDLVVEVEVAIQRGGDQIAVVLERVVNDLHAEQQQEAGAEDDPEDRALDERQAAGAVP